MAARDDVQRVAAALKRPRPGYLRGLHADAAVVSAHSGEAARQLGVFADRVGELGTAELQELHDETFGRGPAASAAPLADRLARHRARPADARAALDIFTRLLDRLDADRNPFACVVRALCCVLLVRADEPHGLRPDRTPTRLGNS